MPVDIGEAVLQVTAGGLPLDAYLAKLQRAIQAMRDVLNEPETDTVEVHD